MRNLKALGLVSLLTMLLLATSSFSQTPTLTPEDRTAIQGVVTGYARALSACNFEEYADLFAPETGSFSSGIRGRVVGRERLIALIQSERQCITTPGAAPAAPRPGGGNGPTVTLEVTPTGVRGVADLGGAGAYQDEYVKTPKGWKFQSRTVLTPAEKTAGLDAVEMLAIQRLAGSDLADYYVPDQNGVKRLRTSGVAIAVTGGAITGKAYLKTGGYYDDVYEKTGPGQWRIKSRTLVPATTP
jgi:hypothetical protein